MRRLWTVAAAVFVISVLITAVVTYNQVNSARAQQETTLQYRSNLVLEGLTAAVQPNFTSKSTAYLKSIVDQYSDGQRIAGLAIMDSNDNTLAVSTSLPDQTASSDKLAQTVMDSSQPEGTFITIGNSPYYEYAVPLLDQKKSVDGAIEVFQYASFANEQLFHIWVSNFERMIIIYLVILAAFIIVIRWIMVPIQDLATVLRVARLGQSSSAPVALAKHPFLKPLLTEVSHIQSSLAQAQRAVSEQTKQSLAKIDSPWTRDRLQVFAADLLQNRSVVVVSDLEPYIHSKQGNVLKYHQPASGLITAIEPIMTATKGLWIASGRGPADKLAVDQDDKIQVPPSEPSYTLKRVWLTEEEEKGFKSVNDNALYPLCHMAHVRPVFKKEEWEQYKRVNGKFAETILAEIKGLDDPVIFIQDFQFTLVPRMIKNSRPDATIGLFWHIPWVSAETFSICPWKKEILDGMLGADLLGFHTQLHCHNFINSVARELEALIDHEHDTVTRKHHASLIKPFQASVDLGASVGHWNQSELRQDLLKPLGISSRFVGLGVDRLDYIKGVSERLTAIEIFLHDNPSYREDFTFIQISAPPEGETRKSDFEKRLVDQVARINNLYQTRNWKPIVFLRQRFDHRELADFYRASDVCVVSSLHDGMNLVAKEFVAARSDGRGVLVLSQFAGAANELADALIINPYNAEETAEALKTALSMSVAEQSKRLKRLRAIVSDYNVYRWSAEFLRSMAGLR